MRPRALTSLLFGATVILAGCARHETPVAVGNREQVLHQSITADPNDLDPQLVSQNQWAAISMALNEGLTNYDPVDLHPVPGVADSWDRSADGLTYTFHLRQDARWSDGQPVVADDFVFSAHRILSPGFAGEFSYMFFVVKGAEDFNLGKSRDFSTVGIHAIDPHTLRYDLRQAAPYFLTLIAHWSWYPVPPATVLRYGAIDQPFTAWTRVGNFVGNGPFTLERWTPGDRIVVKRSPTYWNARAVRLSEVDFHVIDNADSEELAFRSGQLHIASAVPPSKIDGYRAMANSPLMVVGLFGTDSVSLNLKHPPLDDPRVRQALSLAIDRSALATQVLHGTATPANSLVPPDAHGYRYAGQPQLQFDPAAARRLLALAGFPGGAGFPKLELSMPGHNRSAIAEAVQQMWFKELGLEIALKTEENRVEIENVHHHRFDLGLNAWLGDYLDPMTFMDAYQSTSGHDDPSYESEAYNRLVVSAAATADVARRFARFQLAESRFLTDLPVLPLFHNSVLHLVQPSVRGYAPNLMDMHPYTGIWLAP